MTIGFSTGSLARGDFLRGIEIVRSLGLKAIELSALREEELAPLVSAIDDLPLAGFEYVSVHAPSRLQEITERQMVEALETFAARGWPIVTHPDVIQDFDRWRILGPSVCIENMDQRKATGRTVGELRFFFEELPESRLCLDIAHAAQIDPTMTEARRILGAFGDRLVQVHVSSLDSASNHGPLTLASRFAFRSIAPALEVPWILESVVSSEDAPEEISYARELASAR